MLEEIKNIKSEKSDLLKFGITIGIVLMIISGLLFWKENESFWIFINIGIVLFVLGVAMPSILKPVYLVWMVFATMLGWFMTRVILALLFYMIFLPIGLIARCFGKQFLDIKYNQLQRSYWNMRTVGSINKKNYERQF